MNDDPQDDFGPIVGDVLPAGTAQSAAAPNAVSTSATNPATTSAISPDGSSATNPATRSGSRTDAVSEDQVRAILRKVKDPDLNLNIVDLGLIYGVRVDGPKVNVDITLTSPGCPSGPEILGNAEQQIKQLPGVEEVQMNLVWAPFWSPERIEPRVRAYLGL